VPVVGARLGSGSNLARAVPVQASARLTNNEPQANSSPEKDKSDSRLPAPASLPPATG
jgi:hypothetical protein